MDKTFLARHILQIEPNCIEEIFWSPAPIARTCESAEAVYLKDDWARQLSLHEKRVFPPPPKPHREQGPAALARAALRAAQPCRKMGIVGPKPVKFKQPKFGGKPAGKLHDPDPSSSSGSCMESEPSSGSCSDIPEDAPVIEAVDKALTVVEQPLLMAPAPPSHAVQRRQRKIVFGPFSVSRAFRDDICIGIGGNCRKHRNVLDEPHTFCKRFFGFLLGESEEHTRCLAKKWLLMGARIPSVSHMGRHNHLFGIARDAIPVCDEQTLDAGANALPTG